MTEMKMVPVEPTEAMLSAVTEAFPRSHPSVFPLIWSAMLAAVEGGKFRKKPVVIDALEMRPEIYGDRSAWPQWLEDAWNLERGKEGSVQNYGIDSLRDGPLQIVTLEGIHNVQIGDWIIRGVKGELYPCKPDIFAVTYEPAALTAREEAPAELLSDPQELEAPAEGAGEEAGLIRELSDAAKWRRMPGNENHHGTALLFERAIAALRTQAPDSWRPDRGAVARIVDGWAFDHPEVHYQHLERRRNKAVAKADAILALRPQTAESGE